MQVFAPVSAGFSVRSHDCKWKGHSQHFELETQQVGAGGTAGSYISQGEDAAEAKRDIQTRKALACEERKKAAAAIASKPAAADPKKRAAKAKAKAAADKVEAVSDAVGTDPTNAAYYADIEADN